MSPSAWILLLLGAGLAMMVLEVFVPSGGVLGLLAVLALAAGVVTAFVEQGVASGMVVLAAAFLAVPVVLAAAFHWFPATPLGRRVLPPPPRPDEVLPDAGERQRLRGLVGSHGRTLGELVPWGDVQVAGESFEAVSDGGAIAGGVEVDVVGVQGRAVVVRVRTTSASPPPQPVAAPEVGPPEPRLSSLLEEFDFDQVRQNKDHPPPLDRPPSANQA